MKFLTRGLYALILTIFFQTSLSAEYLYKDEVIFNPKFNKSIDILGKELYEKTGISVRLLMLKKLPDGVSIVSYEKEIMKNFTKPTVLLTFSEMDHKVDILANPTSLYEYFDKKQILSPIASPVQAFVIALVHMNFHEMTSGGTILPLLAQKAKAHELLGKYSAAMFNGYADIIDQISSSKNVVLKDAVGNTNKNAILIVKTIFYITILIALYMYIKRRLYIRKQKNELK